MFGAKKEEVLKKWMDAIKMAQLVTVTKLDYSDVATELCSTA